MPPLAALRASGSDGQGRAKVARLAAPRPERPMNESSPKTDLNGQTAIVTGGARGFGLAIGQRLARAGCRVAIWDLNFEGFSAAQAGFEPVSLQTVDVSKLPGIEAAFADTLAAAGSV